AGNDSSGGNSSGSSSSSSSSSGSSSSGSSGGSDSGGSDSGGGDTGGGDTGWGSDRRLKTDIRRLGTSPAGIPVYAFRYIWGGPLFIGTMAQDLLLIRPDAAIQTTSGYYMVNYEKLDIDMISVAEGISLATAGAGATAVALAVDAASKRQRKPPAVFSSQRAVQPAI
ncbi:tail fiber domain-containing protein, partial [Rhizobium leguminosarum]